jgi:hypothetical protein
MTTPGKEHMRGLGRRSEGNNRPGGNKKSIENHRNIGGRNQL